MAKNTLEKEDLLARNRRELTPKEQRAVVRTPVKYADSEQFLHCQKCLSKFLESGQHSIMSPHDAMEYEASIVPFKYPDGVTARIVVIWCKRCGDRVWDSRHLGHMF